VKEGAAGTRRNKGGVVGHVDEMWECRKKGKGKEGERNGKEGVAARMIFFGSFRDTRGRGSVEARSEKDGPVGNGRGEWRDAADGDSGQDRTLSRGGKVAGRSSGSRDRGGGTGRD